MFLYFIQFLNCLQCELTQITYSDHYSKQSCLCTAMPSPHLCAIGSLFLLICTTNTATDFFFFNFYFIFKFYLQLLISNPVVWPPFSIVTRSIFLNANQILKYNSNHFRTYLRVLQKLPGVSYGTL